MKQMIMLESSDLQTIMDGGHVEIELNGSSILVGYIPGKRAISYKHQSSKASNMVRKKCPHCSQMVHQMGMAPHMRKHPDKMKEKVA